MQYAEFLSMQKQCTAVYLSCHFGKSILIIIIGENGAFYGKMTHSILVILSKHNMYDVNASYP